MIWRKFIKIWLSLVIFITLYILFTEDKQGLLQRFQRKSQDKINFNNSWAVESYKMVENKDVGIMYPTSRQRTTSLRERMVEINFNELNKKIQVKERKIIPLHKESCKPYETVVFIKTHKTGSSTITNILNRFADLNYVKVALPMGSFYRFRWPVPFHWSSVDLWRLDGDTPNILCNHARYNRPTMQLIMRKGAKYITILRNPVNQYESMFNYMEFNRYLQLNQSKNPLADFVENPVPYLYKMREKFHGIPESMNLVKNPMFFDLGMYPPAYDNLTRVKEEIGKLKRDFELVMIMEYFDESLILLKKALCWQLEDILYVKFNQRKRFHKIHLSEVVKSNIRQWNKADVMLYELFNKSLWRKIQEYGPSFSEDLDEFRKINSKMEELCVEKREVFETGFGFHGKIRSFLLNPAVSNYDRYFCKKIIRNETEYIDYFRRMYKPYGSYQNLLEEEGKKKPSTRELIERLQEASQNIKFANSDSIPRAVT